MTEPVTLTIACRQFVFGRCHAEALGIVVPDGVAVVEWSRPPLGWLRPVEVVDRDALAARYAKRERRNEQAS